MLKREEFLGYNFIIADNIEDVALEIKSRSDNSLLPIVLTPNVDYIVKLNSPENFELSERLKESAFILPDGQPIVWASKLLNRGLKRRLTGSDLFVEMYRLVKHDGTKCLFLTSSEPVSAFYKNDCANAFVYTLPFIQHDDNTILETVASSCLEIINDNQIKIVFIGVGFPKQDKLALKIIDLGNKNMISEIPTFALLGASLEFRAGIKRRAPKIFQKMGLEWFYRFSMEPRRLFRRYFVDSFEFLLILLREKNGKL